MRHPVWFGSMASQMFLFLLGGIVAAAALAFTLSDVQRRQSERRDREQRVVERVVDLAHYLGGAPERLRPDLLGHGPEAPRLARSTVLSGPVDAVLTDRLTRRLGAAAKVVATRSSVGSCVDWPGPPPPPPPQARARDPTPRPPTCRLVVLSLSRGERVAFILPSPPKPPHDPPGPLTPAFLAILAGAAAALAYGVARLATAPLRRLSKAAVDLGADLDGPPLASEGPTEVRQAADAFNAMQVRLKREMSERTYMLAAITHDLQTPMTRLRLRLEKVAEPELRGQLLDDQAAMLEMIRDGLDLARASSDAEPFQDLDVDSLLHSLCEDAAGAGADVAITERCECVIATRPQALKRCVGNLMDNALKYAGSAELSARAEGGGVAIRVRDQGPGIPIAQLARVGEPFVRLDPSRSRESGGVGLGLTIAHLLAERAGVSLQLSNRSGGGLEALIVARPKSRSMGPP